MDFDSCQIEVNVYVNHKIDFLRISNTIERKLSYMS